MPRKTFPIRPGDCYHAWTVLRDASEYDDRGVVSKRLAECRCRCGNTRIVYFHSIRLGASKSCGCENGARDGSHKITHGLKHHRLYPTWLGMMQRCYNDKVPNYADYGARGVRVCSAWSAPNGVGIRAFIQWNASLGAAGHRPGLTLDRCDNDGNYGPDNCEWNNGSEQNYNSRRALPIHVWFRGTRQTLREVHAKVRPAVSYARAAYRYQRLGWSLRDALMTPSL